MKYRVHLFVSARVPIEVEAGSHEEAIQKAEESNLHALIDREDEIEYADEINEILVDEIGDDEYEKSQWYNLAKI